MKEIEYYKVGFVKNAANEAQSSYMWVSPIRDLCSNSKEVKDVEVFEERVNQFLADPIPELPSDATADGISEKSNFGPGDIVCVLHNNKWVRGDIISATSKGADDESQILKIFLVDHALAVNQPPEMCKSIPENVLLPKEVLSKRLELCSGPLSELEIFMLMDNSLKISLQTHSFRLHLDKEMKIFEKITFQDPGNVSQSGDELVWTFNEFRDNLMTEKIETEITSDCEFRAIQLKKKLAEAKINGKDKVKEPKKQANASNESERRRKIEEKLKKMKEKQSGHQSGNQSPRPSSCLSNGANQCHNTDVRSKDEQDPSAATQQEDPINTTGQKAAPTRMELNQKGNANPPQGRETEAVHEVKTLPQDLEEHEEEVDSENGEDIVKTFKRTLQVSQQVSVSTEVKGKQDSRLVSPSTSSLFFQSSGSRPLRLCSRVSDQRFPIQMMAFLSSHGVTSSTNIQSVMWPAMARLSSLVAVAGPGSGKTLGWSLPLLAALADRQQYRALTPGHSPLAVVLCSGVETAEKVHNILTEVGTGARLDVASLLSSSGAPEPHITEFINGSDILVTTPPRILKLLQEDKIIGLERCCHLVIEDGDSLLERFKPQTKEIMSTWKKSTVKHVVPGQLVVVSEKWSRAVEDFSEAYIKTLRPSFSPTVALINMLEGVVYGKVEIRPSFISKLEDIDGEKEKILLEIVGKTDKSSKRVVICCSHKKNSRRIHQLLGKHGIKSLDVNSETDISDMNFHAESWSRNPSYPLIVTDESLQCFPFSGSDRGIVLIHWDVPTSSKTIFAQRFAFVRSCFRNLFTGEQSQVGSVHLLLSTRDSASLSTILPFLKRCDAPIPDQLLHFYTSLQTTKAQHSLSAGAPLCMELVTTGLCSGHNTGKCQDRHFLHKNLDTPDVSFPDIVKFSILAVESPVVYWVKMKDSESELASNQLMLKMARHYNNKEAKEPLETLELNMLVAAATDDGVYKRAKLLEMIYKVQDEQESLIGVGVFLVDYGIKAEVELTDITELLPEFGYDKFPPCAVKVVIGGLVPGDGDTGWGTQAAMHLMASCDMRRDRDRDVVCRGKTILHLRDTLILDRCQVMELQPLIGRYVLKFETVSSLLDSGHGMRDTRPLDTITAMAERANIERRKISEVTVDSDMSLEGADNEAGSRRLKRAFLNDQETELVYMSECSDPENFYLTHVSNVEALKLEDDLKRWFETERYSSFHNPKVGDYVITSDCGEAWRGQVEKVEAVNVSDRRGELVIQNKYTILLLDTGVIITVSASDLMECPEEFLTRLPVQAIQCRLGQVLPSSSGTWSTQAGDRLFDMTRTEEDAPTVLECNLLSRDASGVFVVQLRGSGINLAEDLVTNGHAIWDSQDLDSIEGSNSTEQDFDAPNGLEMDIVDIDKLKEVTGQDLADYLDENLNLKPQEETTQPKPTLPIPKQCSYEREDMKNSAAAVNSLDSRLPTLAVPADVQTTTMCPSIIWSQTDQSLKIEVKVFARFDLCPNQVYIHVERRKLKIEVIEMLDTEETSDVIVHNTPIIELSDEVIPSQTQVAVKGSGIQLTLDFDTVQDEAAVAKMTSEETEPKKDNVGSPPRAQCEFNVELDSDDSSDDEEGEYDNYEDDWKDSMYL